MGLAQLDAYPIACELLVPLKDSSKLCQAEAEPMNSKNAFSVWNKAHERFKRCGILRLCVGDINESSTFKLSRLCPARVCVLP